MSAAPTRAVLITGNGGAVTVLIPGEKPGEVAVLASGEMTACAQCQADAAKYFATGELTEKCSVCGAKRIPLTAPSLAASHAHN
jgi:hypothetical protein